MSDVRRERIADAVVVGPLTNRKDFVSVHETVAAELKEKKEK